MSPHSQTSCGKDKNTQTDTLARESPGVFLKTRSCMMHTTNDSAFAGNREPEKTAGKRPRLVILVRDGLLEMVATDQGIDIEILKVDADDQAEEETIYASSLSRWIPEPLSIISARPKSSGKERRRAKRNRNPDFSFLTGIIKASISPYIRLYGFIEFL